jgi:hypothetical protein
VLQKAAASCVIQGREEETELVPDQPESRLAKRPDDVDRSRDRRGLESSREYGKRGRPREYSDLAIITAHAFKFVYELRPWLLEASLDSIVRLMELHWNVPDFLAPATGLHHSLAGTQKPQ